MWVIRQDEEYFGSGDEFETKEEAIEVGHDEYYREGFYVGEVKEVKLMCSNLGQEIIELLQNYHYSNDGEIAENYLDDVRTEHIKELDEILDKAIVEWATKHSYLPDYFHVVNIEYIPERGI